MSLADWIRHNDEAIIPRSTSILNTFQEDLLPAQGWLKGLFTLACYYIAKLSILYTFLEDLLPTRGWLKGLFTFSMTQYSKVLRPVFLPKVSHARSVLFKGTVSCSLKTQTYIDQSVKCAILLALLIYKTY